MPIDATQPYDENNVFAKILQGELPCNKVYEDEHALAFHDIHPLAPVHILVIPKGAYVSWDDFSERASDATVTSCFFEKCEIMLKGRILPPRRGGYGTRSSRRSDVRADGHPGDPERSLCVLG